MKHFSQPFNDHGSGCKGHQNWMLDSYLDLPEERSAVIKAIDNYLNDPNTEKNPEADVKR